MPEEENNENNQPENNGGGHPAWQEILNELPEEFHNVITPKLQEWDQGVQQKLEQVRSQYEPYNPIFENKVPMDRIEQALALAMTLEQNPELVVENAINHFNLDKFKPQQQVQQQPVPNDEDEDFDMFDGEITPEKLKNHPAFSEFFEKQRELEEFVNSQKQQTEQQQAQQEFETFFSGLHDEHGDFDDTYVAALVANGVEPTDAIEQYRNTVNQAAQSLIQAQGGQPNSQQQNDTVVMGASGTTGSGVPNQDVNVGSLSNDQIEDMVVQMLQQQNSQS